MGIIENLETLIIDRYDALSFTAMRCIKTLIQMINPKDRN